MADEDPKGERLKQLIDEVILQDSSKHNANAHNLLGAARTKALKEDAWVGPQALEYWWHLARVGVIALPGGDLSVEGVPGVVVTARGLKLLKKQSESPHNQSRYLAAVTKRVAIPDPVVMAYLEEAVEAWGSGLYRSSAVMVGCACEKLVLLLARAIVEAKVGPYDVRLEKALISDKPAFISGLFKDVREALQALAAYKKLPTNLADAIDRRISSIFDHARGLRNDVGHPTGIEVTADDAEAGLLMFPGFYEYVHQIISHLKGKP